MQTTNALLNKETQEVLCEECGQPVVGISESMRRTLLSFGQIVRTESRKAFMMACRTCNANREVVLTTKNDTVCGVCKNPITVHSAMKQAIIEAGRKLSEQVEAAETEDEPKKTRKKVIRKTSK
jgi:hypothetical protein